ncbi:MAG: hypothetical protein ACLSHU_01750 [Oscillospiraceae bacterium]
MKQGKQFMKAIMLVLALMVASYILYNVVRSASSGVPTAQAVLYAASDGVSVEGFVVRQETVIPAAYDLVLPTKGEGEKVACGEEVAVTLRSAAAQERQEEINQTERSWSSSAWRSRISPSSRTMRTWPSALPPLRLPLPGRWPRDAWTPPGPPDRSSGRSFSGRAWGFRHRRHARPNFPAPAAAGQFGGQRCFGYQIHRRPVRRVLLRRGRRL